MQNMILLRRARGSIFLFLKTIIFWCTFATFLFFHVWDRLAARSTAMRWVDHPAVGWDYEVYHGFRVKKKLVCCAWWESYVHVCFVFRWSCGQSVQQIHLLSTYVCVLFGFVTCSM